MSKHINPRVVKPEENQGKWSLLAAGLTIIHPFHGETQRFNRHWDNWRKFSIVTKRCLDIILVDDHGTPSVESMLTPSKRKRVDFNLSIYRILDDLKWSTPCALNLGLMAAQTPWTLIMDSDCLFESNEMEKLLNLRPLPSIVYKFCRKRVTNNAHLRKNDRFLPCTMLQHKDLFLDVGGFDEDLTGEFGGGYGFFDNHYDGKTLDAGYKQRYYGKTGGLYPIATEYMEDEVGLKAQRKYKDMDHNKKLMYDKWNGKTENSKDMLRFKWERVYHHRAI